MSTPEIYPRNLVKRKGDCQSFYQEKYLHTDASLHRNQTLSRRKTYFRGNELCLSIATNVSVSWRDTFDAEVHSSFGGSIAMWFLCQRWHTFFALPSLYSCFDPLGIGMGCEWSVGEARWRCKIIRNDDDTHDNTGARFCRASKGQ